MGKELLLEIGSEELPARFIEEGREGLKRLLTERLEAHSLRFERIYTLATPRRLTAVVEGLSEAEPDRKVELKGPAKRAAYDAEGRPTRALEGFMRSQGLKEEDLKTVETPKGEYIYGIKEVKGRPTEEILPALLTGVISSLSFPKTMRWSTFDITYPRPLHWIVALYGGRVVPLSFGPIEASNRSRGHRFCAPEEFSLGSTKEYIEGLEARYVVPSPEKRKTLIAEEIKRLAHEAGGVPVEDDALLEEVTNLVEYPVVIRGSFDEEFLNMPDEVIIDAMRSHQRYFSIKDSKGRLLPAFITVANTPGNIDTIRKGNERVLRARLNDAQFYYERDKQVSPIERVEELKGVLFQARLGTSYQKVLRFTNLALFLAERLGIAEPPPEGAPPPEEFLRLNPATIDKGSLTERALRYLIIGRASMLAKSDLTSGMVGEFPKLQGIMGREYARLHGELPEVYHAIYEHYLPQHAGDSLPSTDVAALISIADKLDTIVGCFAVNIIPTGTQDPYGLRRLSLGIIAIILQRGYRVSLKELVERSAQILKEGGLTFDETNTVEAVLQFFKERLRQRLLSEGLSFDSIEAVLSTQWFDLPDTVKRINCLEEFKAHPAFAELVVAFKRVSNILKGVSPKRLPDEGLLVEEAEKGLYRKAKELEPLLKRLSSEANYKELFEALAGIKESVDAFFDKVKVMAEDERLKENRLALLGYVRSLYIEIADLSKITVQL